MFEIAFLFIAMTLYGPVCFLLGASVRQKVDKGEEIKMPTVNPMAIVREHREQKEAEEKKSRMDAILRNIDAYDGTEIGQEEVPKG